MPTDVNGHYRPNVLWFSMEDTTPRFACYGDEVARQHGLTPHIDALAARGRLYRQAFSTAPVSAPSRFSIITGVYAHVAGAHHMRTGHANRHTPEMPSPYEVVPPHYVKCFTEYLRAAGYYCTNNNKTDYQFQPPRTAWDDCSTHGHWRNRPDPSQPFFAVFNPTITHESGQWARQGEPTTPRDEVEVPPYLVDASETRKAIARQYDNIKKSDALLGERIAELKEDGLFDDTIVFLWSDHGEGLPRRKRWPLDSGTRIPLIIAAGRNVREHIQGLPGDGEVVDDLASLIDLAPTVLTLCGIEPPLHLSGRPMVGPKATPREYAFATRDRFDELYDMIRSVRDDRFRYVRNCAPELPRILWNPYSFNHKAAQDLFEAWNHGRLTEAQSYLFAENRPPEELYDLENDPDEIHNLADDPAHAHDLRRLSEALDDFLQTYGDLGNEEESQMVERMWPNRQQPKTPVPLLIPIGPENEGTEFVTGAPRFSAMNRRLRGPARIMVHPACQGASIAWTFEQGPAESVRWNLYTGPIPLPTDTTTTLRVRSHRYGYRESEENVVTFDVE